MKSKPLVIFILGGPGSGKGTQCSKIRDRFSFVHLSAGDLLRQQRLNKQSFVGKLIQQHIVQGKIVPSEITVRLLQNSMISHGWSSRFLIDGFPRNLQNLSKWRSIMCQKIDHPFIIHLKCLQQSLIQRLLKRGQTSGRSDDNLETIRKRFTTYKEQTMHVIKDYERKDMLLEVNADAGVKQVFQILEKQFINRGFV